MQAVLHLQQLVTFALHHLGDRNTGSARDHFSDLFGTDLGAQQTWLGSGDRHNIGLFQLRLEFGHPTVLDFGDFLPVTLARGGFHFQLRLLKFFLDVLRTLHLRLLKLPHFFEVSVFASESNDFVLERRQPFLRGLVFFLAHRFAFDLELDQPAVELVHRFRFGIDFHLDTRGRLVDQIDRLVRKKAVGDIAMRQLSRRNNGRVGDIDAVVHLVFFLQSAQDRNRALHRGLIDQHLLKAALERGILLHIFAIFVERGGADTMQFAARQRRLQHIAGINRAFRLTRTDHGVQFIDKDYGAAGILGDFLEHRFQTLFELTTIFRPRQHGSHIE